MSGSRAAIQSNFEAFLDLAGDEVDGVNLPLASPCRDARLQKLKNETLVY